MSTQSQPRHDVVKKPITLSRIYIAEYQKEGTKTAELRQEVTTVSKYPSKKVDSDLQDNLFNNEDFNFEPQVFTSTEIRMAWMPIPEETTEEVVKTLLGKANEKGGTIYRVLSNKPILDENQKYAITQGLRDMDHFANAQVCRYPDNHEDAELAGELMLDKAGNVQYRRTFFAKTPKADMDLRDGVDVYMSPEILAEVEGAGIMQTQRV